MVSEDSVAATRRASVRVIPAEGRAYPVRVVAVECPARAEGFRAGPREAARSDGQVPRAALRSVHPPSGLSIPRFQMTGLIRQSRTICSEPEMLGHDPENWKPVFGEDHAQTKDKRPI